MGRCTICYVKKDATKKFFAKFPSDENRCREWVKIVGDQDLVHLPIEKLCTVRFICGDHFEKRDFNKKGNRLKKRAVPKLKLTRPPLSDEVLHEFPLHTASVTERLLASQNISQVEPSTSPISQNQPLLSITQDQPLPSTSQAISPSVQESLPLSSTCPITVNGSERNATKRKFNDSVELTPRKKKLIRELEKTKCTLSSLKKSAKLIDKIESPMLKSIIVDTLKNQSRKPKGRRWTTRNKISALAILKRSPKAYKFLGHIMPLPSVKTLQNVLRKVPMDVGINGAALQYLAKQATAKDEKRRMCVLLFDEVALKPCLTYNEVSDQVDGFEDLGVGESMGRSDREADHALVFMIQGLYEKFKQPLAYYFVKGTISSQKLTSIITDTIKKVNETGYRVLATVCDQGPTNMGALKLLKQCSGLLGKETDNVFLVDGQKVYIVYDIPHLFKSIRNNFLNNGTISMDGKTGKWAHLRQVEEKNHSLLHLSKISATHVNPQYRAKMRVKYAAQMLSNTVSAVLKLISVAEKNEVQAKELMDTALIVEKLDRLFDFTNGPSNKEDVKKGRRENCSHRTDHLNVWAQYRQTLSTVKFFKSDGTEAKNNKCVQGYILTLSSLQDIWHEVNKVGFKYLNLRNLNQDALENLFGIVRQHSPTNKHPTCTGFISALKTSIITGLTAPHNRASNCEKDSQSLLTSFHDLVFEIEDNNAMEETYGTEVQDDSPLCIVEPDCPELHILEELDDKMETDLTEVENQPIVYLSGYIAYTLKSHNCNECKKILTAEDHLIVDPIFNYIQLREWWHHKKSLTYPSLALCRMVETAVNAFQNEVILKMHERNICAFCVTLFTMSCDTTWFTCEQHKYILNDIFNRLARLLIRRQCYRVNQKYREQEQNEIDANKRVEQRGSLKK